MQKVQKGHLFKKLRKKQKNVYNFLLIVKIKSKRRRENRPIFCEIPGVSLYLIAHPWVVQLARNMHINHHRSV